MLYIVIYIIMYSYIYLYIQLNILYYIYIYIYIILYIIYSYIYVGHSISFQTFLYRDCRRLLKIPYVIAIHLERSDQFL